MRIAHISDLHIGKRLYDVSLLEDQRIVLKNITDILVREKADILIIAGDVYDKPTPGADAVRLFDDFVAEIMTLNIKMYCISGNHDSMERISFGSRIMWPQGIYFQENFRGEAQKFTVEDSYGRLNIFLIPFIKPAYLGKNTYEEAFAGILDNTDIDYNERNILVAHQFVTATKRGTEYSEEELERLGLMPERCQSESINVGGLDNISYELFRKFDYVALGHLHRPQYIGEEYIRYSGSPMKYSFQESLDNKGIQIVDFAEKGKVNISSIHLDMPKDVRVIKGTVKELTDKDVVFAPGVNNEDYICAIVTDEERVADIRDRLLRWYPNLLNIQYQKDMDKAVLDACAPIKGKTPYELFEEYFEMMNGRVMTNQEEKIIKNILGRDMNET